MSSDQSSGGLDRGIPNDPLFSVDQGRFWEWYRHEWSLRTWFGRLKLMGFLSLFSPILGLFAVVTALEGSWPATYKEEVEDER